SKLGCDREVNANFSDDFILFRQLTAHGLVCNIHHPAKVDIHLLGALHFDKQTPNNNVCMIILLRMRQHQKFPGPAARGPGAIRGQ
ncbi:MAG: hypothetical protein MJE68_22195, partial [Proteobacteria bacterium]|nr:hypothetical protein [Pseudomonadota bacterium]